MKFIPIVAFLIVLIAKPAWSGQIEIWEDDGPEAKYTRVYSIYKKIDNPDDQEEIKKHIEEIWKRSSQPFNLTTKIIQSFRW